MLGAPAGRLGAGLAARLHVVGRAEFTRTLAGALDPIGRVVKPGWLLPPPVHVLVGRAVVLRVTAFPPVGFAARDTAGRSFAAVAVQ
jgi:hypothetical protein